MLSDRGAALLEVIVALVVLSTAGIAAVLAAGEATAAVARARQADERAARASAFLDAVALWPREDLDRRLGDRPQGPWRLRISRPEPDLYVISLADSGAARAEILHTALFRPDSIDAVR